MTRKVRVSKNSKTVWAVSILLCLAFITSINTAKPAHADEKQTMFYDVYGGGFHVVDGRLDVGLSKQGRYDLTLFAKTHGFLGRLAPWHGTFESNGWALAKNDYRTELHRSITTWRDEEETKTYSYNKDRSFNKLVIKDHDKEPYTYKTDQELTGQTTDVLTATLMAMQEVVKTQNCNHDSNVFDGKRRFKLKFKHKGHEELSTTRYNIYDGPSTVCVVEVIPDGGAWHKKPRGWMSIQEQGRDQGMMPTVWMAQIREGEPAVPVKIQIKTAYGSLFMHLAEYRSGSTKLISPKRKKRQQEMREEEQRKAKKD